MILLVLYCLRFLKARVLADVHRTRYCNIVLRIHEIYICHLLNRVNKAHGCRETILIATIFHSCWQMISR